MRSDGPLVETNCAALPRELLESELFGHEAGAFTGARKRHRGLLQQADHGTLFLDEISEMGLDIQTKLLKAIEDQRFRPLGSEREVAVDVQMVAASNRDLGELAPGRFPQRPLPPPVGLRPRPPPPCANASKTSRSCCPSSWRSST
jgi:transcriptional regulator with PAS, ATPase and Fis domain